MTRLMDAKTAAVVIAIVTMTALIFTARGDYHPMIGPVVLFIGQVGIYTQLDRLETETRDAAKERLLLDLREYELLKNAPDPEWTEFFIRTHWKPRIPWP